MKSRTQKILLWVFGAWVVLMLALSPLFLAAHRETEELKRTFAEYTDSLVRQDFGKAYAYCGSDFHSAMSYDQFADMYKSLQGEYGPLKSAKIAAYEVHGRGTPMSWRATVDADLVYEKKSLRFEFVFHKEGDRWVLFGSEQL
jgi:hypothetical protein